MVGPSDLFIGGKKKKKKEEGATAEELAQTIEPPKPPKTFESANIPLPRQLATNEQVPEIFGAREKMLAQQFGISVPQRQASRGVQVSNINPQIQQQREQAAVIQGRLQNLPLAQVGQPTAQQKQLAAQQNITPTLNQSLLGAAPDIVAQAITGAAGGAAVGALKGSAGGPFGMGALAGIGALTGLFSGTLSQLKEEEQQAVSVQYTDFINAKDDLQTVINYLNSGGSYFEAQARFNYILAKIDRTESNLKLLEERDWLSKAKRRLTAVESFNQLERTEYIRKFREAALLPDKTKIILTETPTEEAVI